MLMHATTDAFGPIQHTLIVSLIGEGVYLFPPPTMEKSRVQMEFKAGVGAGSLDPCIRDA